MLNSTANAPGKQSRRQRPLTDDEAAYVAGNTGLAYAAALRMARGRPLSDPDIQDEAQEALLGLCRARLYHDPEISKFSTYGSWSAMLSISQHREHRAKPKHAILSNAEPLTHDDGNERFGRFDEDADERMEREERLVALRAAIRALPRRERLITRARLRGITLQRIGDRLGVAKERVRQVETRAKAMLRAAMLGEGVA
jgi:RNA polymerase sigma factor (sigma-70 family)